LEKRLYKQLVLETSYPEEECYGVLARLSEWTHYERDECCLGLECCLELLFWLNGFWRLLAHGMGGESVQRFDCGSFGTVGRDELEF